MDKQLVVNEIFGPTIQGEGKSAGKCVMFLRLAGCNLACSWCDTPYTWNWVGTKYVHPEKYNPRTEMHPMSIEEVVAELITKDTQNCKSLVVSGGEPMLQQRSLIPLLSQLKQLGWWIEIETNGTVNPTSEFISLVDQINCSPKLSSSGPDNPTHKRLKENVLKALTDVGKTNFKFVITSDSDLCEVEMILKLTGNRDVYVMPEGRTKSEQNERMSQVQDLADRYGFCFSPRLHILKWGTMRGV